MHILVTNFNSNPNIGLFGYCNNDYCLIGIEVPRRKVKQIEKVLDVPVYQTTICGTSLMGIFCTGNSNCLLVPEIAFDSELEFLEKKKIKYKVINSKLTALGNNILTNDNGCLVNPDYSAKTKKQIRQALNVSLRPGKICGLNTVGSVGVLNSFACLIHADASESDLKMVKDLLKINIIHATVNMGSPYLRSGILCNDNGVIIGDKCGGYELSHIEENLGFLEKRKKIKTVVSGKR